MLGPPRLVVDVDAQGLYAGGQEVKVHPADLAFALWFARRARLGQPGLPRPADGVPEPAYAIAYLAEYDRLRGRNARTDTRYRHGMSQGDFDERRSRLNKSLRAALGRAGAAPYLIEGVGYPKCYALALPPGAIEITGE